MEKNRKFRVGALGLSEKDGRLLKSIALLSSSRVRSYTVVDGHSDAPELYVVDADNAEAVAEWNLARARRKAPAILINPTGQALFGQRGIKRPIAPSLLLSVMDEVVVHDLGYMPEVRIGQGKMPDAETVSIAELKQMKSFLALVVDDSPTVRAQIEIALRGRGVAAHLAENAEQAHEYLATTRYDIIFLDVVLPGGTDGYQICKAIKRDKSKKDMPVIMLTGKGSPFDRIKGSLAGCDTYLTKPVENAVFQEVLKKYLRASEKGLAQTRAPSLAPNGA